MPDLALAVGAVLALTGAFLKDDSLTAGGLSLLGVGVIAKRSGS